MSVLKNHKAPHITQHHQDMLINGIHMKQVMLHLANNFSEGRKVAT